MIKTNMIKNFFYTLCFLVLFSDCTPSQLIQKLNENRRTDSNTPVYFNSISSATKAYVDSTVRRCGIDSTISMYSNDAWFYLKIHDYSKSMSRFNRILYLDSLNPNPYWGYGLILFNRCKIDSSLWYLKKAQTCDPENVRLNLDFAYTEAIKASAEIDPAVKALEFKRIILEYQNNYQYLDLYPILRIQFIEILDIVSKLVATRFC